MFWSVYNWKDACTKFWQEWGIIFTGAYIQIFLVRYVVELPNTYTFIYFACHNHKRILRKYSMLHLSMGIEWSLKNDGSWQIFSESQNLGVSNCLESCYSELVKIKQVSESRILKFESRSLASQPKI